MFRKNIYRYLAGLIFIIIFSVDIYSQSIVINELMSSNSNTISDEDSDYPDWIEIYNSSSTSVNLNGFGLSDSVTLPLKWTFPDVSIPPGQFILAFASGKDRYKHSHHWETIINWGDEWKYMVGTQEPPADWRDVDFDDSSWPTGLSGFGYGDNDDATVIPATITCYIRKVFNIDDIEQVSNVLFHTDFDDGFVAYLNGVPIAWENIYFEGSPPPFDQTAITYTEPLICYGNRPYSYQIENWETYLQTGNNVLAVQVHNSGMGSSDLTIIPFLTLGMDSIPENPTGVPLILQSFIPRLHTNFKIKSSGESLILSNAAGQIIDQTDAVEIPTDISYGRQADGSDNWFYFLEPSPNSSNTTTGYNGFANEPIFSIPGGFYSAAETLSLSGASGDEAIYYSTDGSEPNETSLIYTTPVSVNTNSIIRARIFGNSTLPSRIVTNSYLFDINTNLPLISLVTDSLNLFDWNTGIYEMGPNASPDFPHFGANFWENWERPVNIELFNNAGIHELNNNAGVKIFGGWSRGFNQKSMAFFARKQYGESNFNTKLFHDKEIYEFESFIVRNSGNDWQSTMFRDAMMTGLLKDMNIDRLAYRPSVVYINKEYWGILNIREKINEHYIASNHPEVDPENIDLLEGNATPILGDASHYNSMLTYISNSNFSYETVKTLMDTEEFIDYELSQIYFNNTDWPGNNIKFWRPRTPEGKWRWVIYDTDFGFGIWNPQDYSFNTLAFALDPNGTGWPNPAWSTYLLRRLVMNLQFRNDFINRFADMLNTTFVSDKVITHIDTLQNNIEAEIPFHINRWGGSLSGWYSNVNIMKTFAINRVNYVRSHILSQFNLPGTANVTVSVFPPNTGSIHLNTIDLVEYPWQGYYFKDVPITISAVPASGYRFTGWSGSNSGDNNPLIVNLTGNSSYTAHFTEDDFYENSIVINEINYNSSIDYDVEDWIEFHNVSDYDRNISGWIFKDSIESHSFVFPQNTIIEQNGFLVLCRDTVKFKSFFPEVNNITGNIDFGLSSGGELIRLFDHTGLSIDSVPYDDQYPWPVEPDGNGPTLELNQPLSDNSLGENWSADNIYGSPGEGNNNVTNTNLITEIPVLYQNYPNPFTEFTKIDFYINKAGVVKIEIFDFSGKAVFHQSRLYSHAGNYEVFWNACSPEGKKLPQGIYFYKLSTEEFSDSKKAVLIR